MKKRIIGIVTMAAIVTTVAVWNFNQNKNGMKLNELGLANVEALAQEEAGGGLGQTPVTESCTLISNGWVTASVKRVCYYQYVCPSCSCTPVECGKTFYN